eukprot:2262890-Prymnesium_polylepis.1
MTQWVATVHLDFWNVQPGAAAGVLDNVSYAPLWRFLNRYAGLRWARQARGAWIGFRDGLDAMDTSRFGDAFGKLEVIPSPDGYPEVHGAANKARALAICNASATRGCTIEVPDGLVGGPMVQRRMCGLNDVAFGNWRGDYGSFMARTDAREPDHKQNTRGWWRVGPKDQLFGRFARGFAPLAEGAAASANAAIGLTLDRGLWGGLPLSRKAARALLVRIIFLDDTTRGGFAVHADTHSGAKVLGHVSKRGSGRWRELCMPLSDARFSGAGPNGADLWLVAANGSEGTTLFDSVEVAEGGAAELALSGCDWHL